MPQIADIATLKRAYSKFVSEIPQTANSASPTNSTFNFQSLWPLLDPLWNDTHLNTLVNYSRNYVIYIPIGHLPELAFDAAGGAKLVAVPIGADSIDFRIIVYYGDSTYMRRKKRVIDANDFTGTIYEINKRGNIVNSLIFKDGRYDSKIKASTPTGLRGGTAQLRDNVCALCGNCDCVSLGSFPIYYPGGGCYKVTSLVERFTCDCSMFYPPPSPNPSEQPFTHYYPGLTANPWTNPWGDGNGSGGGTSGNWSGNGNNGGLFGSMGYYGNELFVRNQMFDFLMRIYSDRIESQAFWPGADPLVLLSNELNFLLDKPNIYERLKNESDITAEKVLTNLIEADRREKIAGCGSPRYLDNSCLISPALVDFLVLNPNYNPYNYPPTLETLAKYFKAGFTGQEFAQLFVNQQLFQQVNTYLNGKILSVKLFGMPDFTKIYI